MSNVTRIHADNHVTVRLMTAEESQELTDLMEGTPDTPKSDYWKALWESKEQVVLVALDKIRELRAELNALRTGDNA